MFTKNTGSKTKNGQIKFDIDLAKEYGVEEAIVIGILYDPSFMLYAGKDYAQDALSQDAFEMVFLYKGNYPWDIIGKDTEDGRTWIALNDREYKILFPFWKTDYTHEIFNRLVDKKIFDIKKGHESRGIFYSLSEEIKNYVLNKYK